MSLVAAAVTGIGVGLGGLAGKAFGLAKGALGSIGSLGSLGQVGDIGGLFSSVKGIFGSFGSSKEAEEARSVAERRAAQEAALLARQEKQAGEYYQLQQQQMELQSQAWNIQTLADLIDRKRGQPAATPQIITTPPAKQYSAIDQINNAIGRIFNRAA